ncbi:MAG: hypothetical protein LDL39_18155, partial [Magnetospirillum sp.]|nr:hypothetical protein [Magnetospirillum sp.]
ARGANLAQAQAQAREAVAGLSGSGDPAVSLSEALASGKVAALTAGMSSSAAAAFEKTLSGALARGASVAESLAQARGAAAQADGMDGAARNNPLGELATGGKRTGTEGAAYDRALSAALAAGLPLDQAQARARDAARAMAAATGKLTEADALASGKRLDEVLGARAKDPVFMAAFNRALAAGKDVRLALAEADKAARDAKVSESNAADRLPEALATGKQVDPAKTPHSGELQGQAKALFDRVLGRTLQGGASLADSIKRANAAVAEFQAAEAAATSVPSPQFTPPRAQASR